MFRKKKYEKYAGTMNIWVMAQIYYWNESWKQYEQIHRNVFGCNSFASGSTKTTIKLKRQKV